MSSPLPNILCAIPAYNCEKQISRVLADFDGPLLDSIRALVVIENRSTDGTWGAAQRALETLATRFPKQKDKFSAIQNPKNVGLGGSQKVAFRLAAEQKMDAVIILHGDHQASTRELSELIQRLLEDPGLDAVLGARFIRGSRLKGYSRLRRFGNRALNLIYTLLTRNMTYDLGSGLNLFRVSVLGRLPYSHFSDSFTFNMDLLLALYRVRARVAFIPITWTETDQVSNAKTFSVGWIALKTVIRDRFSSRAP